MLLLEKCVQFRVKAAFENLSISSSGRIKFISELIFIVLVFSELNSGFCDIFAWNHGFDLFLSLSGVDNKNKSYLIYIFTFCITLDTKKLQVTYWGSRKTNFLSGVFSVQILDWRLKSVSIKEKKKNLYNLMFLANRKKWSGNSKKRKQK